MCQFGVAGHPPRSGGVSMHTVHNHGVSVRKHQPSDGHLSGQPVDTRNLPMGGFLGGVRHI